MRHRDRGGDRQKNTQRKKDSNQAERKTDTERKEGGTDRALSEVSYGRKKKHSAEKAGCQKGLPPICRKGPLSIGPDT